MNIGFGAELDRLAEKYYPDNGTRKHISYLAEYERILSDVRHAPLRILELGVSSGASLLIWHDYLPNATIVGLDIGGKPASLDGYDRIQFVQASQDDIAALDLVGQRNGPFDLIIDDASHVGYLTKRSFCHLYPRWLKPGGHYVIEDFGTAFLPEYPDGRAFQDLAEDDATEKTVIFTSHQYGMVGVIKQLIDHMMRELMLGMRSFIDIERLTILTNVAFIQKPVRPDRSMCSPEGRRENTPSGPSYRGQKRIDQFWRPSSWIRRVRRQLFGRQWVMLRSIPGLTPVIVER
jgi:hypothetical protein